MLATHPGAFYSKFLKAFHTWKNTLGLISKAQKWTLVDFLEDIKFSEDV